MKTPSSRVSTESHERAQSIVQAAERMIEENGLPVEIVQAIAGTGGFIVSIFAPPLEGEGQEDWNARLQRAASLLMGIDGVERVVLELQGSERRSVGWAED